jgi:hypothetical protein
MKEKIYVLTTTHQDGEYETVNRDPEVYKAFSSVEVDRVIQIMETLETKAFLFSPLKKGGWVALCSTVNNRFDDDHRPGPMVVALFFEQHFAEKLLEEPVRVLYLKHWMEHLDSAATMQLRDGLEEWPREILAFDQKSHKISDVASQLLQVVMANLTGETCYALSEGDDQDLLQLLQILPLKFRFGVSFSTPYIEFDGIQIYNGIDDAGKRIKNPPNYRRYDVKAGANKIKVGTAGKELAKTILRMRENGTLDRLDAYANDQKDLMFQLNLFIELSRTIHSEKKKMAKKLMQNYPEAVPPLLPYLSDEERRTWEELLQPPRCKKPAKRKRKCARFALDRLNVRVTTILLMVLLVLGYLLVGVSLEAAADAVYVSIHFNANVLFNIGFGLILGLCFGYLTFHDKNDNNKGGKS